MSKIINTSFDSLYLTSHLPDEVEIETLRSKGQIDRL